MEYLKNLSIPLYIDTMRIKDKIKRISTSLIMIATTTTTTTTTTKFLSLSKAELKRGIWINFFANIYIFPVNPNAKMRDFNFFFFFCQYSPIFMSLPFWLTRNFNKFFFANVRQYSCCLHFGEQGILMIFFLSIFANIHVARISVNVF